MLDQPADLKSKPSTRSGPRLDFQQHLADLEAAGLVERVDAPINKDTELHPLVRWQFVGGVPEEKRRAFVFSNVTDSKGRKYDIPVVVGALAASPDIYAIGMGRKVEDIGAAWLDAIAHPLRPAARCRGRPPASTRRRISPRPCASAATRKPGCRTWAPTGRRSKPSIAWRYAWWRARQPAPAVFCIGSNTASSTNRCRSPS